MQQIGYLAFIPSLRSIKAFFYVHFRLYSLRQANIKRLSLRLFLCLLLFLRANIKIFVGKMVLWAKEG